MRGQNITPAGWYPDPFDSQRLRYWDGGSWSGHVRPASSGASTSAPHAPSGLLATSASTRSSRPWWQTWLAIVPGLVVCLPLGLFGLWRRRGTSTMVKTAVTAGTVLLLGIGTLVSDDPDTPSAISAGPTSNIPTGSSSSARSASPSASPSPTPSRARVPVLKGLDLVDAKRALRAADLEVGKIERRPSSRRKGTVLEQGVGDGREVKLGSRVPLVVAAPLPRVPESVGKPKASAIRKIRNAGFKVEVTTQTKTTGQDGVVLRQSPTGGKRVKPRSIVRIVISKVERNPEPRVRRNCTSGYSPCLSPASDYDCAGGSGDGPKYVYGPVRVTGSDPYDLDRDGDGIGCQS